MACKCTNSDGTLRDSCIGTCHKSTAILQGDNIKPDAFNAALNHVLSIVDKRVDDNIEVITNKCRVEFYQEQLELYKKAFLEGLREGLSQGIEIGKNIDY